MSVNTIWTLPALVREEISVAPETGLYKSEDEFIADAIRTLLSARPDVRVAIARRLYERGAVSLGRAAELSDLDIEAFKTSLHENHISRAAPETPAETKAMADAAMKAVGDK